jgi:hypothetical protein
MYSARDAVCRVIAAFNASGVPHMLTGSLASNAYGVPRMSRDANVVVESHETAIGQLARLVAPELVLDQQSSFETTTLTHRWKLVTARRGFEVELFQRSDDLHDVARFSRRVATTFLEEPTWLPTAEDVLVQKLRWASRAKRSKDVEDALNIVRVRGSALDWPYIRRWCDEHGSRPLLEDLRERAGVGANGPR